MTNPPLTVQTDAEAAKWATEQVQILVDTTGDWLTEHTVDDFREQPKTDLVYGQLLNVLEVNKGNLRK